MLEEINTLEDFAHFVWDNNFKGLLGAALNGHFDQWIPVLPIGKAYEQALEDLWTETILVEFPEFKFNEAIKKDIIKWCDENLDSQNGISIS